MYVAFYCVFLVFNPAGRLQHTINRFIIIFQCCRCTTMLFVTLCLLRSTWILLTTDGARHRCQFDGAVCASVVLVCWHLLPTWLQPQALRSSLPVSFLPIYVILKTAESPLLLLPGHVRLIIHHPTHNPYSRLLRWFSVPGTVRVARCSMTCYWRSIH